MICTTFVDLLLDNVSTNMLNHCGWRLDNAQKRGNIDKKFPQSSKISLDSICTSASFLMSGIPLSILCDYAPLRQSNPECGTDQPNVFYIIWLIISGTMSPWHQPLLGWTTPSPSPQHPTYPRTWHTLLPWSSQTLLQSQTLSQALATPIWTPIQEKKRYGVLWKIVLSLEYFLVPTTTKIDAFRVRGGVTKNECV